MNRITVDAPETTKRCPNCGSTELALIDTHNIKMCGNCLTNITWLKSEGQPSRYGVKYER